ncbi:hypothetical protein NDU88_000496 [Pleurodeles waltl]|uniref:KRAB domain-containing protein n=1 Tax=Pleurodeles waltl TaxID=8319 RepID=A0AAV7NG91_PLEWA|nr:hypothetical protein NDU88_000496 [Pleurodeles waltl]
MSHQSSDNALLTFQHVVACFSQEERKLLYEWQEGLYANLMKEIHQVLTSLGSVIANSIFSLRTKEKDGVCSAGKEDTDRRQRNKHLPSQESDLCLMEDYISQGRESSTSHSSEHALTIEMISDGIKEESVTYPTGDRKPEEVKSFLSPEEFPSLLFVPEVKLFDLAYGEGIEGDDSDSPGFLSLPEPEMTFVNTVDGDGKGEGHTSVTAGLEKEVEACSVGQHCTKMKGGVNNLKEKEFIIEMISDGIKEEEEVYPVADQDSEEVKNIHSPGAKQPKARSLHEEESEACLQKSHQQVFKSTSMPSASDF